MNNAWPLLVSAIAMLVVAFWSIRSLVRSVQTDALALPVDPEEGYWRCFLLVLVILSISAVLILSLSAAWRFTH